MLQERKHISQVFPLLFASEIVLLDWQAFETNKQTNKQKFHTVYITAPASRSSTLVTSKGRTVSAAHA